MTLFDLFVSATLAQVTLIALAALILIWFARRHPAFRHAAGVVGLSLAVGSPLLVLALPKPVWLGGLKDSQDLNQPTADQSGHRESDSIQSSSAIAKKADVYIDRSRSAKVDEPLRRIPGPIEGSKAIENPAPSPLVAKSPMIVESGPPKFEQGMKAQPRLQEIVQNESTDSVKVSSRRWGISTLVTLLSVIWSLGILASAVWDWRRRGALRLIARTALDADLERISRAEAHICSSLGLSKLPQVRVSDLVPLPIVLGVWKPIVLLPREILASSTDQRLRDILIHECAHVARNDCWVHLLQRLSGILFWFHPVVYWLNAQIGRAREELCDNFVLMSGDAAEYAQTLLELAESCGKKQFGRTALGLFSTRWTLEQRVEGLLNPARDKTTRTWRANLVMLTIFFACLSLLVGGIGLLAQRVVAGDKSETAVKSEEDAALPSGRKITIRGKCVDDEGKPVANATVRVLYDRHAIGAATKTASDPMIVVTEMTSDASGDFVFTDVIAPKLDLHPQHQRILYVVATAEGRAPAVSLEALYLNYAPADLNELHIGANEFPFILSSDRQRVSGVVTDPAGRPVSGARVFMGTGFKNPIPGMWSAVTDQDGRYTINDLERWKEKVVEETDTDGTETTTTTTNSAATFNSKIYVLHPQYAITAHAVDDVPATANIQLKPPAIVEGTVIDRVANRPASEVIVFAKGIGRDELVLTKADASGHYRFQLSSDYYNIWVDADDRIAPVLKAVHAIPEKPVMDANFQLVQGGLITGTVIDVATNKPLVGSSDKPYIVAHYGPACVKNPMRFWVVGQPSLSIGVQQDTRLQPDGRFQLRVAPGRNAVFFMEDYGDAEQSPQFVTIADGEEKAIKLRVKLSTPEDVDDDGTVSRPDLRFEDAELDADADKFLLIRRNALIEVEKTKATAGQERPTMTIHKVPSRERRDSVVNRLLDKFEIQSIDVQQNFQDPWLKTIKEIVDLGPKAVPELIEELDATDDPWMLQLLGFSLRAIDDKRAIPALIRAIPKTIPSSEPEKRSFTFEEWQMYRRPPTTIMLTAVDPELRAFAQAAQLQQYIPANGSDHHEGRYMLESPASEICGALTKLTGAHNGEEKMLEEVKYSVSSPARIAERQQLFTRIANNWSAWWQRHQNDEIAATSIVPDDKQAIQAILDRGGQVKRDGTLPRNPVTTVAFRGNEAVTLEDLNLLKAFPQLQHLRTPLNVNPPEGGMQIIGQLRTLTELHLGSSTRIDRSAARPGLKELQHLPQLRTLSLFNVTGKDLKEIAQLKSLTKLHILGSYFEDADVKELNGLENLDELDFGGYMVSDAGIADLAELRSLTKLDLSYTKITDASFSDLKRLINLEELNLSNTKIKGSGIGELKSLNHLRLLIVNNTRLNDDGAAQIAEIQSLASLHLTNTKITDQALKSFEQLKYLQYLKIEETDVTAEAIGALKRALPNVRISE